ncbi:MAG: dephospho-CoA kinase, partial [Burkholderiaceae bacterium]
MASIRVPASPAAALRIGLTGGVGSGKSTVASLLHHLGAGIVDADSLAHELTASGGAAIDLLRAEFGESVIAPDGALDRATMRALAFADHAVRRRLEAVLHPLIRAKAEHRGRELAAKGVPYVVFVVPLLVEADQWQGQLDRIL